MKINKLFLTDFRDYSKNSWEFDGETTLIVGPNAAGKTNILEAIYCLAAGDSWRTETAKDMVRFGAEVAHIIGNTSEDDSSVGLHLTLTPGFVAGKRSAASLYKVDEVPRRRADFVGRLKVVLFEPESLEIIIGDPSFRRRVYDRAGEPCRRSACLARRQAARRKDSLIQKIVIGQRSTYFCPNCQK